MTTATIANAFSLNMIAAPCTVEVQEISLETVKAFALTSAVGHADTAAILSGLIGQTIPFNRVNVSLGKNQSMIVAQYNGPRLPEGTTTLPEGASFKFLLVTVQ